MQSTVPAQQLCLHHTGITRSRRAKLPCGVPALQSCDTWKACITKARYMCCMQKTKRKKRIQPGEITTQNFGHSLWTDSCKTILATDFNILRITQWLPFRIMYVSLLERQRLAATVSFSKRFYSKNSIFKTYQNQFSVHKIQLEASKSYNLKCFGFVFCSQSLLQNVLRRTVSIASLHPLRSPGYDSSKVETKMLFRKINIFEN